MDGAAYLRHAADLFRTIRRRADRAVAQLDDAAFVATLDAESNSVALLVKHVAGNLRSRWTDVLTTDGEKPDRRRDAEFVLEPGDSRESLLRRWEEGWAALHATLDALGSADLDREVRIRGQALSAFAAIERQKEHYAYHVGQVVFLAKHLAGARWTPLSVPRGQSAAYEAAVRAGRLPG